MTDLLVVAELPNENGRPDDTVVNTFAFHTNTAPAEAVYVDVSGAVQSFYLEVPPGLTAGNNVAKFISSTIERGVDACRTKVYDITGKLGINPATGKLWAHGSPVHEDGFTMPAPSDTSSLPAQIAMCLTLRARDYALQPVELPSGGGPTETIRPRARRTGRLYVGPLSPAAVMSHASGEPSRPDPGFRDVVCRAGENLADIALTNGDTALWCVWSRTAANMHAVTEVQADDSWDVIRSRKTLQTGKISRVFAPVPDLALGA